MSKAQKEARERNFMILCLRRAYWICKNAYGQRGVNMYTSASACRMIEKLLTEMGAETEHVRKVKCEIELRRLRNSI